MPAAATVPMTDRRSARDELTHVRWPTAVSVVSVYAVCSLLSREGAGQIDGFLEAHSSWISENPAIAGGRSDGAGRLLTPAHDRTDGFFVARLRRAC